MDEDEDIGNMTGRAMDVDEEDGGGGGHVGEGEEDNGKAGL